MKFLIKFYLENFDNLKQIKNFINENNLIFLNLENFKEKLLKNSFF